MSGDVRSLIQAAQHAEGRGEPLEAASLLRRAAGLCEDGGRPARAVQLLRHAVRLSPEPAALAWLEALERRQSSGAEVPVREPAAVYVLEADDGPSSPADGIERAVASFAAERIPTGEVAQATERLSSGTAGRELEPVASSRVLASRGPLLSAGPAWCSFCCRPTEEAGALVEGPTGAFVCVGCLREAARLLGLSHEAVAQVQDVAPAAQVTGSTAQLAAPQGAARTRVAPFPRSLTGSLPWEHARALTPLPTPGAAAAPPSVVSPLGVRTPPGEHPRVTPTGLLAAAPGDDASDELLLAHHVETLVAVEDALADGHQTVLLLGPQGSGRSTCLRTLIPRLGAQELRVPALDAPDADVWLLDDAHLLTASEWRTLSRQLQQHPDARLVLTAPLDALPRTPALQIRTSGEERVDVWSTAQLLEAAPGLPEGLAARISQVVQVGLPDEEELTALATSLVSRMRPLVEDARALATQLSRLALASGRGLHELLALVQRLPGDALGTVVKAPRARTGMAKATSAKTKAAKVKVARGLKKGRS